VDRRAVASTPAPTRRGEKDASLRLLQPTQLHEHLQIVRFRSSHARSESVLRRSRHACRLTPGRSRRGRWVPARALRSEPSGGASLDGEPPASTIVRERSRRVMACAIGAASAAPGSPGRAAIDGSSARRLPAPALFAPSRASDIVSDVLYRDPSRGGYLYPLPALRAAVSASVALSSKTALSSDQDAFRRPSAPSPCRTRAFALVRGITRSPPPVSLLACLSALTDAIRLPAPVRPLSTQASRRVCQRARPAVFRPWTERRSSTSATNTIREHHRAIVSFPPAVAGGRLGRTRLRRLVRAALASRRACARLNRANDCRPRFRGPGAADSRRSALPEPRSRYREPLLGALPRPDPLGHLSSRERCGVA